MALAERLTAPFVQMRNALRLRGVTIAHDGVLHSGNAPARQPAPSPPTPALENALSIPCPDPTGEDSARDRNQNQALRLVRQEEWITLAAQMAKVDQERTKTNGGMPIAELLAFGARADVVSAAEHALLSGRPDRDAPLLAGIEALESVHAEFPQDAMIATIVAQSHMDIGWAWRGTGWDIEVPMRNREAFEAHFDRARDILNAFGDDVRTSPLLAGTLCALNAGGGAATRKVVDDYETWIDLDAKNARALRAMGGHLLPRWHGTYDRLELEARRTAARTFDVWGSGGYTWVMFDAIAADTEACARLDLDFFLDGMHDILRNTRDQYVVNLLAAYCANTMGATPTGHDEADYVRAQIADAGRWIVRKHLKELHPMIWAHAARGFDNALRVRCPDRFAASGYADALRYLTDLFRRELASGQRIVFTENGVDARPA